MNERRPGTLRDDQTEFTDETFAALDVSGSSVAPRIFQSCVFTKCDLSDAGLTGSRFEDCRFHESNLSNARLTNARLASVRFERCKLVGINFTACDEFLFDASFEDCDLSFCVFQGMKLRKARFLRSKIAEAEFSGADLTGVDFSGSDLRRATMAKCILRKADLRTATNYDIDPRACDLKGARFSLPEAGRLLNVFGLLIGDEQSSGGGRKRS